MGNRGAISIGYKMIFTLIVLFTLLGSICSVGLAALMLLFNHKRMAFITGVMVSP
jgi:hypothetical protein